MSYRSNLALSERSGALAALVAGVFAAGCAKDDTGDTAPPPDGAPTIEAVTVSPEAPTVGDTLTCAWSGFVDPEGGVDLSSAAWSVGGVVIGDGATLGSGFAKGDSVTCEVTPFDGTTAGAPVSSSVTVGNASPTVSVAVLEPAELLAGQTASCSWVGFFDPDGDADLSEVTWAVNGFDVATGPTFSGPFGDGDTVSCFVTAFDGEDYGSVVSASKVVGNGAPSVGAVTVAPNPAFVGDTLVCTWEDYADPDGDPDLSSVQWRLGGAIVGSGPVLSGGFAGGDRVECLVTPFDGAEGGAVRVGSVLIENSAPSIASIALTPGAASAATTLSCTWSGFEDADGDPDVSRRTWSVDGRAVGSGQTLSGAFGRGDTVSCEVVPFDAFDEGAPLEASVVIGNAAPGVGAVTITPANPGVDDVLTCGWSGFVDLDGDPDQSIATWTVNGDLAGTGPTLSGVFGGRDEVTCTVVPYDGIDAGTGVVASVVVGNAAPSITAVSIEPSPAYADDPLTCVWAGYSDADGDPDLTRVSWTVNGAAAGASAALSPGSYRGGDTVACTATPFDGFASGAPLAASVVITNSPPSVEGVAITPNQAAVGDVLRCGYTFVDADGDADASTVTWTVGGAPAGTGPTLAGGFAPGDSVSCRVEPSDGVETGAAGTASIVINRAPSVASAVVGPAGAGATTPLTCGWTGFSDPDGDADQSFVSWRLGGTALGDGSPLAPGGYARGDVVTCDVTPFDGRSAGAVVSGSVTIANTAPTIASVTVSPPTPTVGTPVTCAWTGFSDPDGDADASTVLWFVDGVEVASGVTLSGSAFGGGDVIMCEVTPFDGTSEGAPRSASVTAGNAAPVLTSVALTPASPTTDTVVTAVPSASDPDGDTLSYAYAWTVNGAAVGETGPSLDGAVWFGKGNVLQVTVVASDGALSSAPVLSSAVTVVNSAPGQPTVAIAADVGGFVADGDDLVCEVLADAVDADGDPVSYLYSWFLGAGFYPDFDDTIAASVTSPGDVWTCTVTPTDGVAAGTPGSTVVEVGTPLAAMVPDELPPEGSPYFFVAEGRVPGDLILRPGVRLEGLGERLVVEGWLVGEGVVLRDLEIVIEAGGRATLRDTIVERGVVPEAVELDEVELFEVARE
jgi:hypothetical protein